jgi:UDP-glucose 4-epimerase
MVGSRDSKRKRPPTEGKPGLVVGVTGATGDLGRLLLPRLAEDPRVAKVIALDVAAPIPMNKVEFRKVDLTRPGTENELSAALSETGVQALYHLAFISSRVRSAAFAHELEVIGSMHVLAAAGALGLKRLIFPSLTALYGARPNAPALITEATLLAGCPGSRFVNDKVEVEHQLAAFRSAHPQMQVLVLRFAPIVGPTSDNPITRWLRTRVVPTLLGFDPLWQVLHEEDAADALHAALFTDASGAFNVAADGVLPLSALVKLSGGFAVPLPRTVLINAMRALEALGAPTALPPLMDYLHYSWVADGSRAARDLQFMPKWQARDAIAAVRRAS